MDGVEGTSFDLRTEIWLGLWMSMPDIRYPGSLQVREHDPDSDGLRCENRGLPRAKVAALVNRSVTNNKLLLRYKIPMFTSLLLSAVYHDPMP